MSGSIDVSPLLKGLEELKRRQLDASRVAVDQFAEHVLGDAQELCPVDTGALKASATAEDAKQDGSMIKATIGFNTDYAAAVHERVAKPGAFQAKTDQLAKKLDRAKEQTKRLRAARKLGPMTRKDDANLKAAQRRSRQTGSQLKKVRQGQPKYLETALRRNAPKMGKFIGDQVRKVTGG